nr:protein kinase-like domain, phloem protein 2-like protein [Tanacetum cinerariifolium]
MEASQRFLSAVDEDKCEEKEEDNDNDECEDEDNDEDEDTNVERDHKLEEGLLSHLAKSHVDEMIDPLLRRQMDPKAFKIVSDTAYWCIKEERADRPYIDQVVKRLEKAMELQSKHENPVTSSYQLKINFGTGLGYAVKEKAGGVGRSSIGTVIYRCKN